MVYRGATKQATPERDATLGLIFRLNNLWAQVDVPASNGDYTKWNSILDRIYCNLLYKEDMVIVKDEKTGEIQKIELSSNDSEEYTFLSKRIFLWKTRYSSAGGKKNRKGVPLKTIAWNNWYHSVQLKDIWLRKLMMKLGLYLKEVEHSPGTALFGTFGHKK